MYYSPKSIYAQSVTGQQNDKLSKQNKDKGKAPRASQKDLGLKDSSIILSGPKQVTLSVHSLMTRHDRVVLKCMSYEEISQEADWSKIVDFSTMVLNRKFKAGEIDWPTPEPSEDESGDDESSEISLREDEPEDNVEGDQKDMTSPRLPLQLSKELPLVPETPSLKPWKWSSPRG
ncbi:hypothetical protein FNV43_RR11687 [Rhamnella rubrinervis]|uniref:Uncharacterized protein n=1 Tax=Rhamnella rubrinervis TaxID=2594499 RepID=A0A8K0H6H4_9ROSA|nr:hypothetical protein FNV43_RR11687 [Rhamnella rubrinervis]